MDAGGLDGEFVAIGFTDVLESVLEVDGVLSSVAGCEEEAGGVDGGEGAGVEELDGAEVAIGLDREWLGGGEVGGGSGQVSEGEGGGRDGEAELEVGSDLGCEREQVTIGESDEGIFRF